MSTTETYLTEEIKALKGTVMHGPVDHVDRNDIQFYAEAIRLPSEPKRLYVDEAYARQTRQGGVVAPPSYFTRLARKGGYPWPLTLPDWLEERPGVNAGAEHEMVEPIRVGDVITTTARVVDVFEKPGSRGKLLFILRDFEFTNQLGKYVGKARRVIIKFPETAY